MPPPKKLWPPPVGGTYGVNDHHAPPAKKLWPPPDGDSSQFQGCRFQGCRLPAILGRVYCDQHSSKEARRDLARSVRSEQAVVPSSASAQSLPKAPPTDSPAREVADGRISAVVVEESVVEEVVIVAATRTRRRISIGFKKD